jgi:pilus assembly protein Flp/PilA
MIKMIKNFIKKDEGAAMPEYGLLVALIAVACIVAIGVLSGGIQAIFNYAGGQMQSAS